MSRNRYTREVHEYEDRQLTRQEKQLAKLAEGLGRGATEPVELPRVNSAKERRSTRLAQKSGARARRNNTAAGFVIAVFAALVTLISGCGTSSSPVNVLAENQRILTSCDRAHPPASEVGIDGTGSSAANAIVAERMQAIESIVRETAICGGYLRIFVFSSSSAATTTLFDSSLRQTGATDNARLQRVPKAVTAAMNTIRQAYGPAVAGLDQRDSAIAAQYRLAAEWAQQLGGTYALHLDLLTDGFETEAVNLYTQPLDPQRAPALAQQVSVPQLPGATVMVAGLGRVAGSPPPSTVVEGLVAYYNALCHRTAAVSCVSVSDYEQAGW